MLLTVAMPQNTVPLQQGWQVVESGFNHWFLPVKTDWQKMWVAKSGKK